MSGNSSNTMSENEANVSIYKAEFRSNEECREFISVITEGKTALEIVEELPMLEPKKTQEILASSGNDERVSIEKGQLCQVSKILTIKFGNDDPAKSDLMLYILDSYGFCKDKSDQKWKDSYRSQNDLSGQRIF
jgi:hypothetical protein